MLEGNAWFLGPPLSLAFQSHSKKQRSPSGNALLAWPGLSLTLENLALSAWPSPCSSPSGSRV